MHSINNTKIYLFVPLIVIKKSCKNVSNSAKTIKKFLISLYALKLIVQKKRSIKPLNVTIKMYRWECFRIFPILYLRIFHYSHVTIICLWRVIITHAFRMSRLQMSTQKLKIFLRFCVGFPYKFRQILVWVFISIYHPQTLKINKCPFRP